MSSSLMGFMGDSISFLEIISLHVIFGEKPYSKIVMTKFMVVDIHSMYNMIIDWPTLNRFRVMVSIYHIVMKFPTWTDIKDSRSNLKESF